MKKLREGYRMTELGELPEEWEIKKLIEVSDKSDKYSFTGGPFGSDLKSCHYTKNGVRVIQLQNMGEGQFINNCFVYTSDIKADELISCNIYPGDIIIAKMAEPVARACKIPEYEKRYLMCSDGIRLAVDKIDNDVDYIMYSINSSYFRNNAIANSTGTTRLRIGLNELRNLPIIIPPSNEQKKISLILSSVDEQIENTDKLIEKTNELKKGLMQRLLTKGIGHDRFKDTEIGRIPEEWEVKKLGDICDFRQGFQIPRSEQITEYKEGYIRYLYITDFFSDKNKLYVQDDDKFYYINHDDIAVANTGNTCGKAFRGSNGVLSNNMFKIFTNKDYLDNDYLWQYINSLFYWEQLNKYFNTAGQPHVGHKNMSELKIALPENLSEQKQIASILSSIDNQLNQYEQKKEKLKELKQGLMQKLLTGKIRVKV